VEDVKNNRVLPVPKHLRDAHYASAGKLGHGEGYKYAHGFEGGHVEQDYLGVEKRFYEPTDRGFEKRIAERMRRLRGAEGQPEQQQEEP
jgi:putative ATPase